MTDEQIHEIMGRMMHPKERRDINLAQSDRALLLAEVERLRKLLIRTTPAHGTPEVLWGERP